MRLQFTIRDGFVAAGGGGVLENSIICDIIIRNNLDRCVGNNYAENIEKNCINTCGYGHSDFTSKCSICSRARGTDENENGAYR